MRRPIKQAHRALFLALQADAKEYPGGVRAIAETMGMNGNTLANGINPDHEAPPPSFSVILEIVVVAQAKRAIFALAAVFPPALIEPCILAGSRSGDIVLDPFLGSGTTAQVAQALGRHWVGCELNQDYSSLQDERTRQRGLMLTVEGACDA